MSNVNLRSIIQKSDEQRYVLGIVYAPGSPDDTDLQDDYANANEIEKACHDFTKLLQKQSAVNKTYNELIETIFKCLKESGEVTLDVTSVYQDVQKGALGLQHENWSDSIGDIVENYIAPCDMIINGQVVTKGTWLMGIILNEENWKLAKSGGLTGLSLGGNAQKINRGGVH